MSSLQTTPEPRPVPQVSRQPRQPLQRSALIAVVLCWLLIVFDGYDLIVYGTVQGSLINDTGWGLDRAGAGTLGSVAFLGMLIGALFAGRLSDWMGRKNTILACTALFSIFTIACALAPNAVFFGVCRFVAGLGLGGLMPAANALTADLVPQRLRAMTATIMMSGVPIGGTIAALLGIGFIPNFGWQSMFWVAALGLVVVLPLAWKFLPETIAAPDATVGAIPASTSAAPDATTCPRKSGFGVILRAPYLVPSVLFALVTLATLFAWYGLGTWLPNLMQTAGHDLGSALTFALALNLGAVAGSFISAWAGDRFGPTRVASITAIIAAASLLLLLTNPPTALVYLLLVLAGIGTHGTQCLILAAIANNYPEHLRGTALGWALGVGRIGAVAAPQVGGWLLAANLGVGSNFIAFGLAAALASAGLATIVAVVKNRQSAE